VYGEQRTKARPSKFEENVERNKEKERKKDRNGRGWEGRRN
jgi:hypothetical protein